MVKRKSSVKKKVVKKKVAKKPVKKPVVSGASEKVRSAGSSGSPNIKLIAFSVLGVAVLVLLIFLLSNKGSLSSGSSQDVVDVLAPGDFNIPAEVVEQMRVLADDDPSLGSESAPVTIVEFSDFQCPFCARFRAQTFPELKEKFIDSGYVRFVYRDLPLSFHQHAQKAAEAAQCAHEQGKFWDFHDLLFENQGSLDVNSLKKYASDLGLDIKDFSECLDSGKFSEEVSMDAQVASSLGISGTPGFIINGQPLVGAQPFDKFEDVICGIIPSSAPCKDRKPPVEFEVVVVNDPSCSDCGALSDQIRSVTQQLFPGASFREVSSDSDEGESLIEDYGLVFAPSFLFPKEVSETRSWLGDERLSSAFLPLENGVFAYRLRDEAIRASWYFSDEMRAQVQAKLNEALDLNLSDGKPQVDFFVMSYCPYGNQAESLLKPVFDDLKGKAYFRPHYVIYNQGSGCYTDDDGTQLCSLHGEVELNQDMRELCVYNLYGESEWFDFALAMNDQCNSKNADSCWSGVAESVGLDVDKISQCFDENKVSYARQEFELNKLLGVTGSPTLFFEGQEYSGDRSSNGYLSALCQGFSEDARPEVCSSGVVEAAPSGASASAASCG